MAEQKDLHSWLMSLLSFEVKVLTALTEEKLRLAEMEKKLFLVENGLDEDLPEMAFKDLCGLAIRNSFASTDEQSKRIQGNISQFLRRHSKLHCCGTIKGNPDIFHENPTLQRIKIQGDILQFLDGIKYFKAESEKHVREKNQKSIPHPA